MGEMVETEEMADREESVILGVLEPIAALGQLAVLPSAVVVVSGVLVMQEMGEMGEISAQRPVMPIRKIVKLPTMVWRISQIQKLIWIKSLMKNLP